MESRRLPPRDDKGQCSPEWEVLWAFSILAQPPQAALKVICHSLGNEPWLGQEGGTSYMDPRLPARVGDKSKYTHLQQHVKALLEHWIQQCGLTMRTS